VSEERAGTLTSPPAGLEDPAAARYQEAPATASICQDTPTRAEARTRLYRDGRLELEGFPVADISEYLPDESVTIWLDLLDPDHDDLTVLSEEFGLHPLAVELMRHDLHVVGDDLLPYYQDVYNQVLRAAERTEGQRDMVSSILETNLTIQGNRMSVITKKVTGWAAVIAVPTLITGFFGMNVPYPGFGDTAGLAASVAVIALAGLVLYLVFKRKDWL
jgi:Mg2+ and Co2+ transporter CorA